MLPDDQRDRFRNPSKNNATVIANRLTYRVVNQTSRCTGPPLIISLDGAELHALDFPPVPAEYITDGVLHLSRSRGTFVIGKPQHSRAAGGGQRLSFLDD